MFLLLNRNRSNLNTASTFRNVFYKTKTGLFARPMYCWKKNEALNDTSMPDRQANEHMCTLWFQGCRQEKNGAK